MEDVGITYILVKAIYEWSANYAHWPAQVDNRMSYYIGGVQGIYAVDIAEQIAGISK